MPFRASQPDPLLNLGRFQPRRIKHPRHFLFSPSSWPLRGTTVGRYSYPNSAQELTCHHELWAGVISDRVDRGPARLESSLEFRGGRARFRRRGYRGDAFLRGIHQSKYLNTERARGWKYHRGERTSSGGHLYHLEGTRSSKTRSP